MPTYFIDTNIFIYAKGKDHPLKSSCISMIKKIGNQEITAIINTEVIQEILYRYQSIKKLPSGISLAKEAVKICSLILPVEERDLSLAMEILGSNPRIQTRDAFHAATMLNHNINEILSTDPHFDLIPNIRRIQP
ncbi:MAG: type II toxin-antitoxin system VapC family toxin [Deltaproteobacteria bacterium]|nr:type II toxin-antitoxin system VapC family toxin [Deltaproteobacteria bacterium]